MILALAGGVGGAKLASGLAGVLPPERLTIIVNTGDDFEHCGLTICPDLDSICYALAGINDSVRGWGLAGESWNFMEALARLGGETWFNLGDRDLATHVLRTEALRSAALSDVTAQIAARLGIRHRVAPMSDDPVRSFVDTDEGEMSFQHYFVRRRAEPRFRSIRFEGAQAARPSTALLEALEDRALEAIILCPSNPVLSIAPILAVPGLSEALRGRGVPIVAVSPFIAGEAVKGPAAKIMAELGLGTDPAALVHYYGDLLDGLVIDTGDERAFAFDRPAVLATATLMRTPQDGRRLANEVLGFAGSLGSSRGA